MHLTAPERGNITRTEGTARDVLSYVQAGATTAGEQITRGLKLLFSWGNSDKIARLEKQIRQLRGQITVLKEYKLENEHLRRLLDYQSTFGQQWETEVAQVIARDPGNWFDVIRLNKGKADGVRANMPVVVPAGLVGCVIQVSEHSCDVRLITDPLSGVGALAQQSRTPGVVKGVLNSPHRLKLVYISKDDPIAKFEQVVTSGLGSIFPKGIPIGKIVNIREEPSGLTKTAEIEPYVDFNNLEEVIIIVSSRPGG